MTESETETEMLTYRELTDLREDDRDLDMAMFSAYENAIDLGCEEGEGLEDEVARQVNGWIDGGRSW